MKKLIAVCLTAFALLCAAPASQTFTGTITDEFCNKADHKEMKMGPDDAACVTACVKDMNGKYVLFDGKEVYGLSDQKAPSKFAAKKVTVTGTLDAKTKMIKVE